MGPPIRRAGAWARRGVAAAVAAAWLAGATAAGADPAPGPAPGVRAVDPGPHGYFEFTAGPGASFRGGLVVTNTGPAPARYLLSAVPATTSPATGVSYGQPGTGGSGPAGWIALDAAAVDLAPGASTTVGFAVHVPAVLARRGDYVAGIAVAAPAPPAQPPGPGSGGTGFAISPTVRSVVAVVVHVPGPVAGGFAIGAASVSAVQGIEQVVDVPMRSVGDLMTRPQATFALGPCGAAPVLHATRQLDTFLPRDAIVYQWPLGDDVLREGCWGVRVCLGTGGQPQCAASQFAVTSAAQVTPIGGRPHWLGRPGPALPGQVERWAWVPLLGVVVLLLAALLRRRRADDGRGPGRHTPLPVSRA